MLILLKGIGVTILAIYFSKVCFRQIRRIKKNCGQTKALNYLFSNLNKNSKELQIYKNMYVSGVSQKSELISKSFISNISSIKNDCLLITSQKVRRNQIEMGRGDIIYTAPSFFLQNKDQNIEITTLNQLPFSNEFLIPLQAEELSAWDQFLYWFGWKSQNVLAGIPVLLDYIQYGQKTLIYGNFIFNPITSQLRCYKIKELVPESEYRDLRIAYICWELIKLGIKVAILFWLLEKLHQYYIAYQEERYQILFRTKALISHKKQSMQCSKCNINISNILYKPCFHLDCCEACSQHLLKCPVCNKDILEKVKIYNE